MSDTAHFKVFCLERYKCKHNLSGDEAFRIFKEHDVLDYLSSFYDVLHTFGERYIVQDIEEFIENDCRRHFDNKRETNPVRPERTLCP